MNAPEPLRTAEPGAVAPNAPRYQSGFGNQFETEAIPGALPRGRNSRLTSAAVRL